MSRASCQEGLSLRELDASTLPEIKEGSCICDGNFSFGAESRQSLSFFFTFMMHRISIPPYAPQIGVENSAAYPTTLFIESIFCPKHQVINSDSGPLKTPKSDSLFIYLFNHHK